LEWNIEKFHVTNNLPYFPIYKIPPFAQFFALKVGGLMQEAFISLFQTISSKN